MSIFAYAKYWCCELCDFKVFVSEEETMKKHSLTAHGIDFETPYANAGMVGDLMVISDLAAGREIGRPDSEDDNKLVLAYERGKQDARRAIVDWLCDRNDPSTDDDDMDGLHITATDWKALQEGRAP